MVEVREVLLHRRHVKDRTRRKGGKSADDAFACDPAVSRDPHVPDLAFDDLEADLSALGRLLGNVHEHRGIAEVVIDLLEGGSRLLHIFGALALSLVRQKGFLDRLAGKERVAFDGKRPDLEQERLVGEG